MALVLRDTPMEGGIGITGEVRPREDIDLGSSDQDHPKAGGARASDYAARRQVLEKLCGDLERGVEAAVRKDPALSKTMGLMARVTRLLLGEVSSLTAELLAVKATANSALAKAPLGENQLVCHWSGATETDPQMVREAATWVTGIGLAQVVQVIQLGKARLVNGQHKQSFLVTMRADHVQRAINLSYRLRLHDRFKGLFFTENLTAEQRKVRKQIADSSEFKEEAAKIRAQEGHYYVRWCEGLPYWMKKGDLPSKLLSQPLAVAKPHIEARLRAKAAAPEGLGAAQATGGTSSSGGGSPQHQAKKQRSASTVGDQAAAVVGATA
jgi:hypothetical protein